MTTAPARARGPGTGLLLLAWLALAFVLFARHWPDVAQLAFNDNDDRMRLVQLRDWLAGQSWFDVTQYRLEPPGGVAMHWSRLADLPVAGLTALLAPWLGPALAERLAIAGAPLLLLLAALLLATRTATRVAQANALLPTTAMMVSALAMLTQFTPGRIDHHGLQIVLMLGLAAGLVAVERPQAALVAGVCAGLSLAIGLEMAPVIAGAGILLTLHWIVDGPPVDERLRAFMTGLAGASSVALGLTQPPERWSWAACDALGPPVVIAGCAAAVLLALSTRLPGVAQHRRVRLVGALGAGAVLAGGVATLLPACLIHPYAGFDPLVRTLWLSGVGEAQPALAVLREAPALGLGTLGFPAVALLACLLMAGRAWGLDRWRWLTLAGLLGAALATTALQIRAGAAAAALAACASGAVLAALRHATPAPSLPLLLLAWLALNGATPVLVGTLIERWTGQTAPLERPAGADACTAPDSYARLAQMPAAAVLAPIELGTALLLYTPHRTWAATYHRNTAGTALAYRALLADPVAARAQVLASGSAYVLICRASEETLRLADARPGSLIAALAQGRAPAWLRPVPLGAPSVLQLWRVMPAG